METCFFVPGVPVPKGSAKAFWNKKAGKIIVQQSNRERQKPWASLISLSAQEAGLRPSEDPCQLKIDFIMPRPQRHLKRGRIRPPALCEQHTKKPDLDKLIRCVLDALTGIAYRDDSQVTEIDAAKFYPFDEQEAGCRIWITGRE